MQEQGDNGVALSSRSLLVAGGLAAGMGGNQLYVYGVVECEDVEFETDGVEGASVAYSVEQPPLAAVVGDVDTMEPDRSDANIRAHEAVLQDLLAYDGGRTVVPMSFGMTFRDAETLRNLLEGAAPAFTKALEEIEGKIELGVKVVAPPEGTVDGTAIRQAAADRFDDIAAATTRGDQFSDRLVLNRSFLVDRDDQEAFNEAVGEFQEEYDDLMVQYTGPWPAYNFADIQIGAKQP